MFLDTLIFEKKIIKLQSYKVKVNLYIKRNQY